MKYVEFDERFPIDSVVMWLRLPRTLPVDRRTQIVRCGCYEFLRPKRKPRSTSDLWWEIAGDDYLRFTEDELFEFLRQDSRFLVAGDTAWSAKITVSRRKDRRTI